jgi:hypothetical protein
VFVAKAKNWELATPVQPSRELKDRISSPPVLLPRGKDMGPELCVADSGGVVTLLGVGGDSTLEVKREWKLGGRIVAGPFVRIQSGVRMAFGGAVGSAASHPASNVPDDEARIGCVVEQRKQVKFVWIDPHKQDICWEYPVKSRGIVGQPEMADGQLVIAEQDGRYTLLDPQTGHADGLGYLVRGSVVPAAAPVSFGAGRLFAPLSDGTVLLLPMADLRR